MKSAGSKSQGHGHPYVWDTDVLEAMLEDRESIAYEVLTALDISAITFTDALRRPNAAHELGSSEGSRGIKQALLAAQISAIGDREKVSTGHLLRCLLYSASNTGARLSRMTRIPVENISALVDNALRQGPPEA
ncbi:MAG: hypothetical protein WBA31_03595 [Candidatus Dormiibacterota bacterium]